MWLICIVFVTLQCLLHETRVVTKSAPIPNEIVKNADKLLVGNCCDTIRPYGIFWLCLTVLNLIQPHMNIHFLPTTCHHSASFVSFFLAFHSHWDLQNFQRKLARNYVYSTSEKEKKEKRKEIFHIFKLMDQISDFLKLDPLTTL